MIVKLTLSGGMLATRRPWQYSAITIAAVVLSFTGVTGSLLWTKLFMVVGSLTVAGTCVLRVLVGPASSLLWVAVGVALRRRASTVTAISYGLVALIVLFFALYVIVFMAWAIRAWPDQCICDC